MTAYGGAIMLAYIAVAAAALRFFIGATSGETTTMAGRIRKVAGADHQLIAAAIATGARCIT